MVTSAFIKFIIGLFVFNLLGCAACYVREFMIAQVEYSSEQAQKRIREQERKRAETERREIEALMVLFTEASI